MALSTFFLANERLSLRLSEQVQWKGSGFFSASLPTPIAHTSNNAKVNTVFCHHRISNASFTNDVAPFASYTFHFIHASRDGNFSLKQDSRFIVGQIPRRFVEYTNNSLALLALEGDRNFASLAGV